MVEWRDGSIIPQPGSVQRQAPPALPGPVPWIAAVTKERVRRARSSIDDLAVLMRSRHLHGPRRVSLADDDCATVTLLRNGAFFLDKLLAHHRALGVRHSLIIDNGSTDDSVAIARRHPDVTILRNTLPPLRYEKALRRALARRHIKGGWLLFVDVDELFLPPLGHRDALRRLVRYCNAAGFTAVQCQMLDLFSDLSLSVTARMTHAEALKHFRRYSLADVEARDFFDPGLPFASHVVNSRCADRNIRFLFGGIRKRQFGEACCLSKQALVRNLPEIGLQAHPHLSENVRCADVSALLLHYKFAGDVLAREADQVARGVWKHGEDRARVRMLTDRPDFRIDCPAKQTFTGPEPLVEQGFLHVPAAARAAIEGR